MVKKSLSSIGKRLLGIKPKEPPKRKSFPDKIQQQVLKIQGYRCASFGCKFSPKQWRLLEFDHIRGNYDNSIVNCQALCPYHHRRKTDIERRKRMVDKRNKLAKKKY